jgi:crossover junction endodeoxyribonuclease RuvC
MRVLGIDPSSQATGFGIVEGTGDAPAVLGYGVIRPGRSLTLAQKVNEIRVKVEELIVRHDPEEVAIENPFYARNVRTAITLGQVRGAILVAVASREKPLFEYSALEIKKAVTGYGQAEKSQVGVMVRTLLALGEAAPLEEDASDALAAALCHLHSRLFQKIVEEAKL